MYNWLKIGAWIVTGRFLKPRIKGLLLLTAYWFLISFLHGEYRDYVALSGNTSHLIAITLTKIGLYVLGFVVYILAVERKILNRTQVEIDKKVQEENPQRSDDGFDFLRHKKKLQDPVDKLLQKD
jgi:hypothetical protein